MNESRNRQAFTLLEVLIALSLVAALMVLVWSLFATFSRLEGRSRETVSDLEISRSLLRQMQSDFDQLADVGPLDRSPTISTPGIYAAGELQFEGSDSGSDAFGTKPVGMPDSLFADQPQETLSGIVLPDRNLFRGTSDSVTFLVVNDGSFPEFAEEPFLVIQYAWENSLDSSSESDGLPESDLDELSTDDLEPSLGNKDSVSQPARTFVRKVTSYRSYLVRQQRIAEQDSSATRLEGFETIDIGTSADEATSEQPLLEIKDEIPEIVRAKFRYFDGRTWSGFWTPGPSPFPLLVELVVRIRDPSVGQTRDKNGMSDEANELELVVGDELENEFENVGPVDDDRSAGVLLADQLPANFEPEDRRILIRIGTGRVESSSGLSEDVSGQEGEGRR